MAGVVGTSESVRNQGYAGDWPKRMGSDTSLSGFRTTQVATNTQYCPSCAMWNGLPHPLANVHADDGGNGVHHPQQGHNGAAFRRADTGQWSSNPGTEL